MKTEASSLFYSKSKKPNIAEAYIINLAVLASALHLIQYQLSIVSILLEFYLCQSNSGDLNPEPLGYIANYSPTQFAAESLSNTT